MLHFVYHLQSAGIINKFLVMHQLTGTGRSLSPAGADDFFNKR